MWIRYLYCFIFCTLRYNTDFLLSSICDCTEHWLPLVTALNIGVAAVDPEHNTQH